ncbi:MAG: hypothetical protein KatS3mg019_1188 [Fimbriimonadales bacterium]|nr:MAG: hypothetical protein KatS3mg019_1188 [Fimbriimonadales bacterium]
MPFLTYQRRMMFQLLLWAGLSLGVAAPMMLATHEWVRAFGGMTAAWAIINALIAIFALRSVRKKAQQNADAHTIRAWMRQLVRLLWINAALDILYVCVGVGLIVGAPANRMLNAFGWAVTIQGAFLLGFDAYHGWKLPRRVAID